jgi:class 3 adenylate cyclase/predicted ATPase
MAKPRDPYLPTHQQTGEKMPGRLPSKVARSPSPEPLRERGRRGGTCPSCGAGTPLTARFCPQCGLNLRTPQQPNRRALVPLSATAEPAELMAIPSAPIPGTAERRQLTVVFCDLVGSSELAARIDPEDLAELYRSFHHCVAEVMGRYGGFYARPMGDGALVFFGFPRAHEDDAERAVRASLLTIEAVTAITGADGHQPHARIGIATGITILSHVADTGSARGLDAAGEAPRLAARLQQLAELDTVVVAESVRRLIEPLFVYRELGLHSVKGWDKPIAVAQVVRPAANPNRFEARVGPRWTPLVGRRATVERLTTLWRDACNGAGRSAFVTGEPGIGKSRLAAQLMAETTLETHIRIRWFCVAHQQNVALHPLLQYLEHTARIRREDSPELRRTKLESILLGASSEDFTLIASLMQLPVDPRATVLQSSPRRRRERTLRAMLQALVRACHRHPVLAIVEDAHWADPSTSEFLSLVVRQAASLPLLLVVTTRPEFKPNWTDAAGLEHIPLQPLRPSESAELVRGLAGPDTLADEVVNTIVARCDGVPLFLEEVTREVLENSRAAGRPEAMVPASIHASLLARLDRLGATHRVVEAAATIGRDFSIELLRQVQDAGEHDIYAAVRHLVDAGLVLPSGTVGSGRFRFKHTLIQDTAYGMMLRERRRMLHGRIARALETHFPQTAISEPQLLAYHCTKAGLTEEAVGWWLRAGTQSLSRAAAPEALAQLRRGLELCASLSDTETRRRQELDLQIVLGKAVIATEGHVAPGCRAAFSRARALCAEIREPPQLLTVLFQEWTLALFLADFSAIRERAEELLSLARERQDPVWELFACCAAGLTYFELGAFALAHRFLCRGLELFDPRRRQDYAATVVGDSAVLLQAFLSWERMCVGRFTEAWAASNAALMEARALRNSYALALALAHQTCLHALIGTPAAGLATAQELQALTDEHGHDYYRAIARCWGGCCLGQLGRAHEGHALLKRGNLLHRTTGARLHLHWSLRVEAELLGHAGDVETGLGLIREARSLVGEVGGRWDGAEILRAEGELLAQAGDIAAAERVLVEAQGIAHAQGALLFELRARAALAKLPLRGERRSNAAQALAVTARRFEPACAAHDVLHARKLLEELPAPAY